MALKPATTAAPLIIYVELQPVLHPAGLPNNAGGLRSQNPRTQIYFSIRDTAIMPTCIGRLRRNQGKTPYVNGLESHSRQRMS